jgi:hypothetical protein
MEVGFELFSVDYLMGKNLTQFNPAQLINDRVYFFVNACVNESKKFSNVIWGNKITTEQLYGLEDHNKISSNSKVDILKYFFKDAIPNIKIVFILRDGRACIRSKINRTGQSLEKAVFKWKYSVHVCRWLNEHHQNHIVIKYEDLLKAPENELKKVCRFLDVPFELTMLQGTNNPKMPLEYRSSNIDRAKLNFDNEPDVYSMIKEELEYCGYV